MVDIHTHILPGLDDGAESTEEAILMAERAVEDGIRHMAATSHGNYFSYTEKDYRRAFSKLQNAIEERNIPLRLYPGMEIFLDDEALVRLQKKELLTLNQTDYLLVEFDFYERVRNVIRRIAEVQDAGYRVIVAHPERYHFVKQDRECVCYLAEQECIFQVNAGSFAGDFGESAKSLSEWMLSEGLVSVVATDAHDAIYRPPSVRAVWQRLRDIYSEEQMHLWLSENPSRILKGFPVIR